MSYWIVAIPSDHQTAPADYRKLESETRGRGLADCYQFKIPTRGMKVGTLDSLMALSDELTKIDTFVETVVKKCEKTLLDLYETNKDSVQSSALTVNNTAPEAFIESFEWKQDRFNSQMALKDLSASIYGDTQKADEDLKAKLTRYGDTKANLSAMERKESGSLALKPLFLKPSDVQFSAQTEYSMFTPLLVVVPKQRDLEFLTTYEKLDSTYAAEHAAKLEEFGSRKVGEVVEEKDSVEEEKEVKDSGKAVVLSPEEQQVVQLQKEHEENEKRREIARTVRKEERSKKCFNVVPKSHLLVDEDEEFKMYRVFVLNKGVELFKTACKDRRYVVRHAELSSADDQKSDKDKRVALEQDKNNQLSSLIKWCKTCYSELFVSWLHIKAVRVFVESVLRYGLPVNFQAIALKPVRGYDKKLRQVLQSLYANLGGAHLAAMEDEGQDLSGMGEYYPYVSINVDFGAPTSD